jgi:hypothetical protein
MKKNNGRKSRDTVSLRTFRQFSSKLRKALETLPVFKNQN